MKKKKKNEDKSKAKKAAPNPHAGDASIPFQINLRDNKKGHSLWFIGSVALGFFLILKFNTVAQYLGAEFLAIAAYHLYRLIRSFLHKPGRLFLEDASLTLSNGLSHPKESTFSWDTVKHAFLLKRALPWTASGPVLVIETCDKSFLFPHEWFASDNDAKRILVAVHKKLELAS